MENKVFPIGDTDLAFLDSQIKAFSGTKKFKDAYKEKRIAKPSAKRQLFYTEGRAVWNMYLKQSGRLSSASTKDDSKYAFANEFVEIIKGLETIQKYTFTDREKGQGAIRTEEADFEFGITLHRKPVADEPDKTLNLKGLKPHIEEVASQLTASGNKMVVVKNNQITIQKEDGKQMSVKLTRKKQRLQF